MDPQGSAWLRMVSYGPVWLRMAPHGSVWLRKAPQGSVWLRMAPYGSVWLRMAPFGCAWLHMAPQGSASRGAQWTPWQPSQGCKQEFGRWGAWEGRFQIRLVAGPRIELVAGPTSPFFYSTKQVEKIFLHFLGVTCFFQDCPGGWGVLRRSGLDDPRPYPPPTLTATLGRGSRLDQLPAQSRWSFAISARAHTKVGFYPPPLCHCAI